MSRGQQRLREIMKDQGLSQGQIAAAIDVGPDLVSRWLETDPEKRRTKPSLTMAGKLHEKFKIDPLDWGRSEDGVDAEPDSDSAAQPNGEAKAVS